MRTASIFFLAVVAASSNAAAAELHVVGVYGPRFGLLGQYLRDITDLPGLCAKLAKDGAAEAASPGRRVWKMLPADVQAMVRNPVLIRSLTGTRIDRTKSAQRRKLGAALEAVVKDKDFYDAEAFQGVKLPEPASALLKRREDLSRLEVRRLNRLLLEAAFPKEIKHVTDDIPETVTVRVAITGKPVVLALCSFESVRWVIEREPGVTVEKVLIGGNHFQEVAETKLPVEIRSLEDAQPDDEPLHFYAWDPESEDFRKLKETLKKLTGLDITTFQAEHRHEGEPFIVDGKTDE